MKKRIVSIISLIAVVVAVSYLFAFAKVELKVVWLLLFLLLTYLGCVITRKYIKPSAALFSILAGVIITHIPWWISHNINYDISYGTLIDYFFKGTKMFYSIIGAVSGYLLYKLAGWFMSKARAS